MLSYSLLITNTGNVALTNLAVADPNAVLGACSTVAIGGTLNPGQSTTCPATHAVVQADINAGSYTNTATATGTFNNTPTTSAPSSVTSTATQSPAITIAKTTTTPTYSAVGNVLSYSLLITNTGNVPLTNLAVADPNAVLGACAAVAIGGTLNPGQSTTCPASHAVVQADINAGSYTNTATATGTFNNTPTTSAPSSVTSTATQSPAITIAKTTTTPTYSAVGNVLSYSLLITNTGNVALTNLAVADPNAVLGVCSAVAIGGTLNPGQSTTCPATHAVVQADIDAGSYINTATATGTFNNTPITSAPSSVTSTATQTPAITIAKTTTTPTYSAVGNVLSYSLLITNTGNVALTNLAVADPNAVLGACAAVAIGGTLNPGQSTTCPATHAVVQADIDAGSYINTATATGTFNNTPITSAPSSVTSTATQSPAITIAKTTTTPTYSAVGNVLSYSLLITNTGNVPLTNLAVADPNAVLGACAAVAIGGTLNPGQSTTCPATHAVVQADINAGSYTNTATATGTFNNTPITSAPSSVTSTATQSPAITIAKTTTTPTYSAVGNVLSYSLLITNTGNVPLTNLAVADPNAVLGACAAVAIGGTLNPGQSTTCPATHAVVQADINAGSYTNTATATGTFNNAPVTSAPSSVTSQLITATVSIVKNTIGGNGSFTFTGSGIQSFTQTISTSGGTGSAGPITINAGQLTITEAAAVGFDLTSISCSGGAPSVNLATRSVALTLAAGNNISCTFTNTRQSGSILVKKVTIGGDGSFSFNITGPNTNQSFQLANGGQQTLSNLPTGQYAITETSLPNGWTLQSASCGQGTKQNNTVTVTLAPNATLTCTFTNFKEKDDRMDEVTRAFIYRRVDNLLTHGPDRARMLRRLEGQTEQGFSQGFSNDPSAGPSRFASRGMETMRLGQLGTLGQQPALAEFGALQAPLGQGDYWELYGQPADTGQSGAMNMLGASTNFVNRFKFSTSLAELSASAQAMEEKRTQQKLQDGGFGFQGHPYARAPNTMRPGLDLWMEGHLSVYEDSTGGLTRDGRFGIVYLGADYPLSTRVLFGVLAQFDWTKEKIKDPALAGHIGGDGWMAGPYIGVKLGPNLLFDARIAWGTSHNDVTLTDAAAGTRTGNFDTTRWLSTATLTGNYNHGAWRLSPQAGLAYGNEQHDAFTNSLGQAVSGNNISIGRFTLGSEVGYRILLHDGSLLEPHIGVTGIWNFHSDDLVIDGVLVTPNRTRAKLEGGVILRSPGGPSVRAAVAYDGIGDSDLSAFTGKVWLNLPFN